MENLVGRTAEQAQIQACINSGRSEFVVVYGRRRIGKTFLIRRFFNDRYDFSFVGKHNVSKKQQLEEFAKTLQQYSKSSYAPELKDWNDAFDCLKKHLGAIRRKGKKVAFFDEMPWMDSQKSNFVSELENFWNGWAAMSDDILFIACGSATSWIVDKIRRALQSCYAENISSSFPSVRSRAIS